MRRRIFSLASLLSLLLCVGTAALWVRSYWMGGTFEWEHLWKHESIRKASAIWGRGAFTLCLAHYVGEEGMEHAVTSDLRPDNSDFFFDQYEMSPESGEGLTGWGRAGFSSGFNSWHTADGVSYSAEVSLPFWLIGLFWLVLPTVWAIRYRRTRGRIERLACVTCGYSLTGNTSGTCPECGTPIPQPSRPA